jgi:hypothetical protein
VEKGKNEKKKVETKIWATRNQPWTVHVRNFSHKYLSIYM